MKSIRWIKVKLQETIKPNISNKSKNILGVGRVEQFVQRRNVEVSLSYPRLILSYSRLEYIERADRIKYAATDAARADTNYLLVLSSSSNMAVTCIAWWMMPVDCSAYTTMTGKSRSVLTDLAGRSFIPSHNPYQIAAVTAGLISRWPNNHVKIFRQITFHCMTSILKDLSIQRTLESWGVIRCIKYC